MGYHHLAFATRDLGETHRFYAEVMGFELAKAVAAPTDQPGGWAKHLFYDTGGGSFIAFWELHDDRMADFDPAISTGLGLQPWVNHVAFDAADLDDIDARKVAWLDDGRDVMLVDHGFCVSVYTTDPNGILVEFCVDTEPYTSADEDAAHAILKAADPDLDANADVEFFLAADHRVVATPEPAPV